MSVGRYYLLHGQVRQSPHNGRAGSVRARCRFCGRSSRRHHRRDASAEGCSGSAIRAFTGSYAFVAAPRLAFFVTREPDSDRRLLLPVKNNIGPKARGLGYRISTHTVTNGIIAPCLSWSDEPVGVTADQAIAAANAALKDGGAMKEAKEFLKAQLADGPVDAKEALEAADAHGTVSRNGR